MSNEMAIERSTLADRAYTNLLDALLRGDIKPGERLRLDALASQMGTSLAPLREAVARLQAEGVVSDDPRRGVYVASLSNDDVHKLYEARLLLESFAAERAACQATEAQLATILALVNDYIALTKASGQGAQLARVRKDVALHQYLVDLAGNARMSSWFSTLAVQLHEVLLRPNAERLFSVTLAEHHEIYAAFTARDGTRARTAVVAHITAAEQRCIEAMGLGSPSGSTSVLRP